MLRVYSKNNCLYCNKAKNLLQMKGIEYKESILGIHIMQETFTTSFPSAKTMPLIVNEGSDGFTEIIGGYQELERYVNEQGDAKDKDYLVG